MEQRFRYAAPARALAPFCFLFVLVAAVPARAENSVSNVAMTPRSPAALVFNTNVNITFDYHIDEQGGAVIFFRPMTGGSLTPNYAAHASGVYSGDGSESAYFTITAGSVLVDQVRVQIWNSDQSVLLGEEFFDVVYDYAASGEITNVQLDPVSPATLGFGDQVNITFDYQTDDAGGVLVFFRPMTGGDLTPNYAAHGSPLYPVGSGSGTGYFTITAGEVMVDHVRVTMSDEDQGNTYHQFAFPVEYTFHQGEAVEPSTWGSLKNFYR